MAKARPRRWEPLHLNHPSIKRNLDKATKVTRTKKPTFGPLKGLNLTNQGQREVRTTIKGCYKSVPKPLNNIQGSLLKATEPWEKRKDSNFTKENKPKTWTTTKHSKSTIKALPQVNEMEARVEVSKLKILFRISSKGRSRDMMESS